MANEQTKERVGIVGVGRMGLAMAKHLIRHGYALTVCDIDAFIAVEFSGWVKEALPEGAVKAKAWFDRVKARPSAQA